MKSAPLLSDPLLVRMLSTPSPDNDEDGGKIAEILCRGAQAKLDGFVGLFVRTGYDPGRLSCLGKFGSVPLDETLEITIAGLETQVLRLAGAEGVDVQVHIIEPGTVLGGVRAPANGSLALIVRSFGHGRGGAVVAVRSAGVPGVTFTADERCLVADIAEVAGLALAPRQCRYDDVQSASKPRHQDDLRDAFLRGMSHELRTPLTAILGWSEMLASKSLAPAMVDYGLEALRRNAHRQLSLVEDMLDLATLRLGAMSFDSQPVSISILLREAVAKAIPAANDRGVRIAIDDIATSTLTVCDRGRWVQAMERVLLSGLAVCKSNGVLHVALTVKDAVSVVVHSETESATFECTLSASLAPSCDPLLRLPVEGFGIGLVLATELILAQGGAVKGTAEGPVMITMPLWRAQ